MLIQPRVEVNKLHTNQTTVRALSDSRTAVNTYSHIRYHRRRPWKTCSRKTQMNSSFLAKNLMKVGV